jgi:beta-lactamase regulating signal transducer with metallopeptidase domain
MPAFHMASVVVAEFAQAVAPVAVAALWQGVVIAIALVLCMRLAPRVPAAHRFAAWAAGFVVVACLQFLPLVAHSSEAGAAAPLGSNAGRPLLQLDSRWGFAIAMLWLAASAFRGVQLAVHTLRLRRLWKGAMPVEADGNLCSLISSVHGERSIEIYTTRDLDRPGVIGFFAPRILIPEWLYSRLTPGELEQVVLHEAEHLRRRDDWTNLLQKLSLVFFPLNLALVWMERQLCREREMACDERVVRRTQAPRVYAACLATLAERGLQQRELLRRAQALSLGAFARRPELVQRVHSILRRKRALHPLAAGALVGVVCCGLVLGSVELARSPQLVAFVAAQQPDAQMAVLAPQAGMARAEETDAVFHSSISTLPRHFRAIETKAIVPERRNETSAHVGKPTHRGGESPDGMTDVASADDSTPRAELVKAVEPTSATNAAQDGDLRNGGDTQSGEFVVLTAWEEVQTFSPRTRTVADYETAASEQEQTDTAAGQPEKGQSNTSQTNSNWGAQITVTRMIFLVYPASSATPSQLAPLSSHSQRHAASLFDSNWLVLQLQTATSNSNSEHQL